MDNGCTERAESIYHTAGAAINNGTPVIVPNGSTKDRMYASLTVINDSDQDIKVKYTTSQGFAGEFIVPKSIKGYTKHLKGVFFQATSFVVVSCNPTTSATGNITFNLGI